jgi:uncharacterized cupin superfamily protein
MHWHGTEDELVYVVEGEVVLVEQEGGAQIPRAGDAAGFKAGVANGHTIESRSDQPARLLEIGPRTAPSDTGCYVDLDMCLRRRGGELSFETCDGRPIARDEEVRRLEEDA